MTKIKEQRDKELLTIKIFIGVIVYTKISLNRN